MVNRSNQESTVQRVVTAIADLPGVASVTLGSLTAAGFADESSDFDVNVYYHAWLAATADRATRLHPLADEGGLETGIRTFGAEGVNE